MIYPVLLAPLLETLAHWDTILFYLINLGTRNGLFDVIMPFLTNVKNWQIPLILVWVGLIIFGGKRGRIVAVLVIICLAITDQLSSSVLKPLFARTRPGNLLDDVHLLVNCSRAFSFPSSHATNIFAQAALFSYYYKKLTPAFFLVAALVGFSRIYVGVHFPFDVLFGAMLGTACTILVIVCSTVIARQYTKVRTQLSESTSR